jgi:GAF domain-containing protein
LLGTFAIYYKEPRKPTPHDLQLIDEIVGLTATAIETRKADFQEIVGL